MKIAVFGLGYVGAVTAVMLADRGHEVTGVDLDSVKVKALEQGQPPVIEPGLPEIIERVAGSGRLRAVTDAAEAGTWDVAFVCVGTPSGPAGQTDTRALEAVSRQLGQLIRGRSDHPVIVIRSTVAPRVLDGIVIPGGFGPRGVEGMISAARSWRIVGSPCPPRWVYVLMASLRKLATPR